MRRDMMGIDWGPNTVAIGDIEVCSEAVFGLEI